LPLVSGSRGAANLAGSSPYLRPVFVVGRALPARHRDDEPYAIIIVSRIRIFIAR
jgi:hypothetical protein